MNHNLKKIIMAALFAALACVATMSIRIPTPGTGGYVHPGDAIVILSGIILGPGYGFLAAGIGSALADLLGGYLIYVPITFIIKGMVAFASGQICRKLSTAGQRRPLAVLLCGVCDTVFVVLGYFLCEIPLYGITASAASMPANLIQGISGLILASVLYPVVMAVPDIRQIAYQAENP